MADRVAVFNQGRLEQFGTPTEVYDRPASLFVNTFVGTANRLTGSLLAVSGTEARVRLDGGPDITSRAPVEALSPGEPVIVCVRPDQLRIVEADGIPGTVEMGLPLGAVIVHEVRIGSGLGLKVSEPRAAGAEPRPAGSKVQLRPGAAHAVSIFRQPKA
jgi:putative spermidine/putrescine transport system ATP-binding protein